MELQYEIILKMILAVLFGGIVGWQREHIGKAAGMRTYALVSLGSAMFTVMSLFGFPGDTSRVAAQILTGVGFIGAGTIIHKRTSIDGLTTAAGLWSVSAIGMAVGLGWYIPAAVGTVLMFLIFITPSNKWG